MGALDDQTVVITGADRGIGHARRAYQQRAETATGVIDTTMEVELQ